MHSDGEAWQVGASVAALIRTRRRGRAAAARRSSASGISVPGLVRRSDGLVRLAPNLEWHDVSFGGDRAGRPGARRPGVARPTTPTSARSPSTRRGAGVGIDDLIYVSGNVGVGAGVITGGHRLEGAGGYAGEVGHLRFNPEGRPCHCGNRGCWETEVGAHAIAEAIHCPPDKVAQLDEVLDGFGEPSPELRGDRHRAGRRAWRAWSTCSTRSMVVLGGYFRSLYRLVGAEVNAGLADRALPAPLESVTLALPGLGSDSPCSGRPRSRSSRSSSTRSPRSAPRIDDVRPASPADPRRELGLAGEHRRRPSRMSETRLLGRAEAAAWMPSVLGRSSGRTCTAEASRSSSVRRAGSSTRSPSGAK